MNKNHQPREEKQLQIEQESREKLRRQQRRNNKQSKDPNANRYHSGTTYTLITFIVPLFSFVLFLLKFEIFFISQSN